MLAQLRSQPVIRFHDASHGLPGWPGDAAAAANLLPARDPVFEWLLANHRWNCSLWAEEDLARRTRVADSDIAENKRNIDRFNQARNDAIERIDDELVRWQQQFPRAAHARLSSETPGAMIDRMSILSLKIHHMGLQTQRSDVDDAHRERCRERLRQLQAQRDDLAACYDRLLDEIAAGVGYFKVYRQYKMYNDASLNPVLVAEQQAQSAAR
jgi:hypothetical protein